MRANSAASFTFGWCSLQRFGKVWAQAKAAPSFRMGGNSCCNKEAARHAPNQPNPMLQGQALPPSGPSPSDQTPQDARRAMAGWQMPVAPILEIGNQARANTASVAARVDLPSRPLFCPMHTSWAQLVPSHTPFEHVGPWTIRMSDAAPERTKARHASHMPISVKTYPLHTHV